MFSSIFSMQNDCTDVKVQWNHHKYYDENEMAMNELLDQYWCKDKKEEEVTAD